MANEREDDEREIDHLNFSEWLASCRGVRDLNRYSDPDGEDLVEWAGDVWDLIHALGDFVGQYEEAKKLLHLLQPGQVDAQLWEDLALNGEASLLKRHQFGPKSRRSAGDGADKKSDPPTQFAKRQGRAVVRAEAEVQRLRRELEEAEVRRAELQNGLQVFAAVSLLAQMRKATASMFATGPAWTVLRAISGSTGREISDHARQMDTKRILTVLHALRGHAEFEQEVKHALLDICHRWATEAAKH